MTRSSGREVRLKRNVLCDIFIIAAEHKCSKTRFKSQGAIRYMALGCCADESAGRGMNKTSMNKRQLQPIQTYEGAPARAHSLCIS